MAIIYQPPGINVEDTAYDQSNWNGDNDAATKNAIRDAIELQKQIQWFGDGSDGDVTINSGTTTLTRDMYYNNLTITSTGVLNPAGYRIFVKGTLDISSVSSGGGIKRTPNNAGNASGSTAGAAGGANSATMLGTGNTGLIGATGTTGAGANGTVGGGANNNNGGLGPAGGSGGAPALASGGSGGGVSTNNDNLYYRPEINFFRGSTAIAGGCSGGSGGAGTGDGANTGGGGGGSGSGGIVFAIYSNKINRGAGTPNGAIMANASNGGNGGNGAGGNAGGGGGGSGGGGGWIYIVYNELQGITTATGALVANGGAGGNGGNGVGTGRGGAGGRGGAAGRITLINLNTGDVTEYASDVDTLGTAPTTPTTTAGTSGTAGVTNERDF